MEVDQSAELTGPHLLSVRIYLVSDGEDPTAGEKILASVGDKYPSQATMIDPTTILIELPDDRFLLKLTQEMDCRIFTLVNSLANPNNVPDGWLHHVTDHLRHNETVLGLLPEKPISEFTIIVGFTDSEEAALSLSEQCSKYLESEEKAKGIVRGSLITALERQAAAEADFLRQIFLVALFCKTPSESERVISRFHREFVHLAICIGKLDRLRRSDEPFFLTLGTVEQETQETIERETWENLFVNFGNLSQIQTNRLEKWLGELITKFSALSVVASAVRRDCAIAEMYVTQAGTTLCQWNEKALEGYPTNVSTEISQCEEIIRYFRNFLERADALRTQMQTVLDSIQTFLSFAQQKTMERQGNILKWLTWAMTIFTIVMVFIEVLAILHILR